MLLRLPSSSTCARHAANTKSAAVRPVLCRYKGNGGGEHREESWLVYTSQDQVSLANTVTVLAEY
jgi:hypothetical protein